MIQTDVLKAEDVAAMLHIGKNAVYNLAKTGEIGSYHIGRKLLFTTADVEAYVEKQRLQELEARQESEAGQGEASTGATPARLGGTDRAGSRSSDSNKRSDAADAVSGSLQTLYPPFDDQLSIAGDGPITDVLTSRIAQFGVDICREDIGAWAGLVAMYARKVDAAVINLYDYRSNTYNTPFVRTLLPGTSVVTMHLATRRMGFVVKFGNPKRMRTWSSLLHDDVVLANRERGCAERILLDEKLVSLEARPASIEGYDTEHRTAWSMAQTISHGAADVGIGTEQDSHLAAGLEFVALQNEMVDLVLDKTAVPRPLIRRIMALLADPVFTKDLASATSCDTANCGAITYES
jgi:putative molybdopterin biosynthesis protein